MKLKECRKQKIYIWVLIPHHPAPTTYSCTRPAGPGRPGRRRCRRRQAAIRLRVAPTRRRARRRASDLSRGNIKPACCRFIRADALKQARPPHCDECNHDARHAPNESDEGNRGSKARRLGEPHVALFPPFFLGSSQVDWPRRRLPGCGQAPGRTAVAPASFFFHLNLGSSSRNLVALRLSGDAGHGTMPPSRMPVTHDH